MVTMGTVPDRPNLDLPVQLPFIPAAMCEILAR